MKQLKYLAATLFLALLTTSAYGHPPGGGFDQLDQDDDGQISFDEFSNRERGMIERLDQDGDNAVSREEVDAHLEERAAEHQARMEEMQERMRGHLEEMFTSADANGDGLVTQEEATLAAFNKIDENADGFLTKEELRNARPDRRHGKRGKMGNRDRWNRGG